MHFLLSEKHDLCTTATVFVCENFSARRRAGGAADREASSCNASQLPRFLVFHYFGLVIYAKARIHKIPQIIFVA